MKEYVVSEHAMKRLRQRVDGYKHASPRKVRASIKRMLNPNNLVKKVKRGPATILVGDKLCGICVDNVLVTVFKPDADELAKRGIVLEEVEEDKQKEDEEDAEKERCNMQPTGTCMDERVH